ncbi:MAG: polyribonucleotide nucleotidyltransferase, partial [Bdellovibrio sp.]
MAIAEVKFQLNNEEVILQTGKLAKQADGAVLVKTGSNMVLVTVVSSKEESNFDFFPLTVEYSEKFYSTGKIPGGYFKREGRPTSEAILNCRLIDRPLRPCFPEGYKNETQVVATILSYDGVYPIHSLAGIGASAALHISDIPFNGPIATVVIGRKDGAFIVNPGRGDLENSDLELTVSSTSRGILMVEGEGQFVKEKDALEALKKGFEAAQPVIQAQEELRQKAGAKPKRPYKTLEIDESFRKEVEAFLTPRFQEAFAIDEKLERYAKFSEIKEQAKEKFLEPLTDEAEKENRSKQLSAIFGDHKYFMARQMILKDKKRIGGRGFKEVRPISSEVGILPRAHGSALFTRGETQVLGTVTLGTGDDEQRIDALHGSISKRFLLHYNFPPFSVGEVGRMGGQSRREVGHGFLAERALSAIIPSFEKFPYTIRVVSEVLESNGSSSMGTVCAGQMALLDAGVPVQGNVAGIAMGLIKEGDDYVILSDILGDEDHLGDMDFKVAGTKDGITALQMDIKIDSITFEIMEEALQQALEGRLHILSEMEKVIKAPRGQLSEFAPRIETIKVKPEKVREVIGAGGKVIRGIVDATGVKIDIEDDGTIHVASSDPAASAKAIKMIQDICAEAEVGQVYKGKVTKITDFGAFVEVLPN